MRKQIVAKADRVRAQDQILDDHVRVALELGIRGQTRPLDWQQFRAVDAQRLVLALLTPGARLTPLPLRGQVRSRTGLRPRCRRRRLARQTPNLRPQPFVLSRQVPDALTLFLDQVEQTDQRGPHTRIANPAQVDPIGQPHGASPCSALPPIIPSSHRSRDPCFAVTSPRPPSPCFFEKIPRAPLVGCQVHRADSSTSFDWVGVCFSQR